MSSEKCVIQKNLNKLLTFQEFFCNSAMITKNWGQSLRYRPARALQGAELASELILKVAEYEDFVSSRFWTEEGKLDRFLFLFLCKPKKWSTLMSFSKLFLSLRKKKNAQFLSPAFGIMTKMKTSAHCCKSRHLADSISSITENKDKFDKKFC